MRKVGNIVAGFWDFLSTLVDSKKDKDGNSVVVKNYISGNNNQKNTTHNHNDRRKCIFRKNCASVPEERSAIPLQTEQSSAG